MKVVAKLGATKLIEKRLGEDADCGLLARRAKAFKEFAIVVKAKLASEVKCTGLVQRKMLQSHDCVITPRMEDFVLI
jgi:hypothetical protein